MNNIHSLAAVKISASDPGIFLPPDLNADTNHPPKNMLADHLCCLSMADNSLVTARQYKCLPHKTALWLWNKGWRYRLVSKFQHSKSECAEAFMPLGSAFGMRGVYSVWNNVWVGFMGQRASTWMPPLQVFHQNFVLEPWSVSSAHLLETFILNLIGVYLKIYLLM